MSKGLFNGITDQQKAAFKRLRDAWKLLSPELTFPLGGLSTRDRSGVHVYRLIGDAFVCLNLSNIAK